MGKMIDMTGWKMSEHGQPNSILTVLHRDFEFDKIRTNESIRWICQCECGTIKSISGTELRRKRTPTISCGCLARERQLHFGDFTSRDLTHKKFGMLTPLYIIGTNKYHYNIWHCICDCGNEKDVVSRDLLNGDTISCGCQKNSYREKLISELLDKYKINYKTEYTFNNLKDKLALRFDFAILDEENNIKCLVEHQGEQHYLESDWHTATLTKHDEMKKQYCEKYNIPFYEIRYDDNLNNKILEILKREGVYYRT